MLRMDIRINIKLRATCSSSIRKYSKTYSAQKYRKNITPATFPNENLINATLSEVLGQILKDQALLDCLIN